MVEEIVPLHMQTASCPRCASLLFHENTMTPVVSEVTKGTTPRKECLSDDRSQYNSTCRSSSVWPT